MVWRPRRSRALLPAGFILLLPLLATQQQLLFSQAADAPSPALQNQQHSNLIPQIVNPTDESALETLALAASEPAVRAPPVQVSSHANPAPQLQARSLQDWEVEDFVLLATVDGTIHARDRKTGAPRWALEVPNPMVETIYHRANSSDLTDESLPEDDFLWIVEPSRDGNLYIYNQGPQGGLQRLGLTVKMLVDETPYSGADPPVTYTARKETTLYTVDARTGAILRVFSSRGLTAAEQTCRRLSEFEPADGEECESSGTVTLGRIEYMVSVQNTETGKPICTIKYSEWAPNNRDADLQGQYFRTMDERHIYSMHDGVIFGFDHSKVDGRRYTQKFPSPVARVFDVARPLMTDSPNTPLVILAQPPPNTDHNVPGIDNRESRVFINCTDVGGWYAMSEHTYPLVTGRARRAECYERDFLVNDKSLMNLDLAKQKAALVGVHSLAKSSRGFRNNIPSISGPPPDSSRDAPRELTHESHRLLAPPVRDSILIRKGWDNVVDIVVTIILLIIGTFLYYNTHNLQALAKQRLDLRNIISIPDTSLDPTAKPILESDALVNDASSPSATAEAIEPSKISSVIPSTQVPENAIGSDGQGDSILLPPDNTGARSNDREEPSINGDDGEAEDAAAPKSPEKRKKARRGRRGGQAHKRGKKNKTDSPETMGLNSRDAESSDHRQTFLNPTQPIRPRSATEMIDADGAIRIGQLKVYTDKVLGHGSHGTVVYKGSFDGRDVAVKRLLVEFYDIAAHEVGLLQESDDHNNVIRYFCREQTAGFLYIALELCPASLQDIVERSDDYPELLHANFAVPDMLRQITAGVRYLHSLKIVHRDLKPQNILVSAPKARAGSNAVRLLISDFGLCKKLEDNQSSFRATTAHAAGTSGWRAPELLVDDDQNPVRSNNISWDNYNNTSMDSSEPAVVDPQTNRRATRAIDIFSLGCVFYYVLTRGSHPFDRDGKFMREANIVNGYYNLDELKRLGNYAYEAEDLIGRMLSGDPRRRSVFGSIPSSPSHITNDHILLFSDPTPPQS